MFAKENFECLANFAKRKMALGWAQTLLTPHICVLPPSHWPTITQLTFSDACPKCFLYILSEKTVEATYKKSLKAISRKHIPLILYVQNWTEFFVSNDIIVFWTCNFSDNAWTSYIIYVLLIRLTVPIKWL